MKGLVMKKIILLVFLPAFVFAGYLDDPRLDSSSKLFPDSGGTGLDSSRYLIKKNNDYDDRYDFSGNRIRQDNNGYGTKKAIPYDREPIIKSRPY